MKNGEIHRNGIRTLAICCGAMNCHHQGTLDVELQVQLLGRSPNGRYLGVTASVGADPTPSSC